MTTRQWKTRGEKVLASLQRWMMENGVDSISTSSSRLLYLYDDRGNQICAFSQLKENGADNLETD